MPYKKGDRVVGLHRDVVPRLEQKHQEIVNKSKGRAPALQNYVNEIIRNALDKEDLVCMVFPQMSKIAIEGNCIFVKDDGLGEIFDIYFHDGKLMCGKDRSFTCDHVLYAWALPELGYLEPSKLPKIKDESELNDEPHLKHKGGKKG